MDRAGETPDGQSMADWLALHGATAKDMLALLEGPRPVRGANPDPFARIGVAPETAWDWAATAARLHWPSLAPHILDTARHCLRRFDLDPSIHKRPFTLQSPSGSAHIGQDAPEQQGNILVGMAYRGHLRDLLNLAHEFGHAVQLTASQGRFMPPILREVCAYLVEAALVAHLPAFADASASDIGQAAKAVSLWQDDSARLAGPKTDALIQAIRAPDTPYDYGWNYPPARVLSTRILGISPFGNQHAPPDGTAFGATFVADLFAGKLTVSAFRAA